MSAPTSTEGGALAFIVLGSNIDPARHLCRALELLAERLELRAVSRVYESAAFGSPGAPPFLNAAVLAATDLPPARLKHEVLRPIERELGRVRGSDRNAPRSLDLDLALYGDLVLEDSAAGLVLPDPEIARRAYLALPLAELAPEARHPVTGETLGALARRFAGAPGIRLVEDLRLPGPPAA